MEQQFKQQLEQLIALIENGPQNQNVINQVRLSQELVECQKRLHNKTLKLKEFSIENKFLKNENVKLSRAFKRMKQISLGVLIKKNKRMNSMEVKSDAGVFKKRRATEGSTDKKESPQKTANFYMDVIAGPE